MQTRWESLKEVGWGTFIGLIGAWIITRLSMEFIDNRDIATTVSCLGCTVWSLFRGYHVRRYFDKRKEKQNS